MPRDYADSAKSKKSGQLPGWVWLLGGLTIGLFIAFLVYLDKNTPSNRKEGLSKVLDQTLKEINKSDKDKDKTKPTPVSVAQPIPSTTPKPAPKFDFYYILPEMEVAVPDQELAKSGTKEKPLDSNTSYILQAASFKSREEADRLKAKLALAGVEANIQSVTINNDPWYRVRVGPMNDLALLNKTRKRLQENGITAIVVKAR